ncbi:hypothetical protein EJ05DRAFT_472040 [Pseudovirgaria hyperparasitica]|uniref:Uncharacterized protein n=1 Tax=Pseudovirgaria hyperparasitica TaxID=470096 RepID=A0A6A6WLR1_9PEZI|nr:uncharacterized protein EJ05DRAFT_472040 [Pseudovirgaria hyperparasitica]KAF2763102.1 hypothetical protein EJ05DRAFT_472040 [Pseudovirgaria hyperparasitica]
MSSSYSYSSSSFSSSTSTSNGQTTGQAYREESSSNLDGTTVRTTTQNLGEKPVSETRQYDAQGRQLVGDTATRGQGKIEDISEEEADKIYRERMEDEYAKREGGA